MNLQQLKQKNPSLYAELIKAGVTNERAHAVSLLTGKERTPAEKFAIKCIKNGTPLTETIKARHLSIQINSHVLEAKRLRDSEQVVQIMENRRRGIIND